MAITLFGTAKSHTDGASVVASGTAGLLEVTVTPPSSMVAGHLVVLDVVQRATSLQTSSLNIVNAGGQTWTSGTAFAIGSATARRHWCRFDGTWDADPSVYIDGDKGSSPYTVVMTVWAPSVAGSTWASDTSQADDSITVSSTLLTVPAVTTVADGAIAVSFVASIDDNNHTLDTAGNWTSAIVGWDNIGGSGLCSSVHYCVKASAGSTGTYVLKENAGGANDNALYLNQSFIDTAPSVKKVKLLAPSDAVGETALEGVVLNAARDTVIGEFTGQEFVAGTGGDSGFAVLKIDVADITPNGSTLTTSDTPLISAKNGTYGTVGLPSATVIEE